MFLHAFALSRNRGHAFYIFSEVDYVPLPQGPPGGGAAPHSVSVPSWGIGLGLVTACRRTAVLLGLGAGFALSLSELRMIAIFSEAP